ncbi:MAG: hemerythrin domain-containing protein [Rubrivivax sp.]|nr:hemerythrin domain-containing protein [Rubrivivax sp.]
MTSALPFPGLNTPAVGFEQPYEMLGACHDRVRRSLDLLQRLQAQVGRQGHDDSTRAAAADVLRYFDLAAPLHHEDEELHVFPRLLAGGDPAMVALVARLQDEHLRMAAAWAALRGPLTSWAGPAPAPAGSLQPLIAGFSALYAAHLEDEDGRVFPAAAALTAPLEVAAMAAEMAARRRR